MNAHAESNSERSSEEYIYAVRRRERQSIADGRDGSSLREEEEEEETDMHACSVSTHARDRSHMHAGSDAAAVAAAAAAAVPRMEEESRCPPPPAAATVVAAVVAAGRKQRSPKKSLRR